jgi:hypothetical protein
MRDHNVLQRLCHVEGMSSYLPGLPHGGSRTQQYEIASDEMKKGKGVH